MAYFAQPPRRPYRGHVPQDHRDLDRRRPHAPTRILYLVRAVCRGAGADLHQAVALRGPGGPAGRARRLLPAGDRQGEHHRPQGPRGRVPRVLQRLPPPGNPPVRGAHRQPGRHHPVPVPRLDLRPRRPADRRAVHQRDRELRQARLAAPPRRRGDLGWLPVHQSGRRAGAVRPGLGAAAGPVHPVQPGQPRGGPHHRVRRPVQLEAAVPELLRVLPLRPGASRARQAHAAHQRRERPDRRPVHRRLHGAQPRHREHDDERAGRAGWRWASCPTKT